MNLLIKFALIFIYFFTDRRTFFITIVSTRKMREKKVLIRLGHSTTYQLLRVSNSIRSNKSEVYSTVAALLNIEKTICQCSKYSDSYRDKYLK